MRAAAVVALAIAAAVLITFLAGLVPGPESEPCVIPGHQRTTVVECEQP